MSDYSHDSHARRQRWEGTAVIGDGAVNCGPHVGMATPLGRPVVVDQASSNVDRTAS